MKGASGQHLVDQLQNKIEEVHSKHRDEALEIWWTPRHEGIKENERADKAAKRAARGNSSPDDQLPCTHRGKIKSSRSAARQTYTKKLKTKLPSNLRDHRDTFDYRKSTPLLHHPSSAKIQNTCCVNKQPSSYN